MVDTGNKTSFSTVRQVETPAAGEAASPTTSPEPIKPSETPSHPSDSFARAPTVGHAMVDQSRPTQGLWNERRGTPQRLLSHSDVLRGATSIALRPGQDFGDALKAHYGQEMPSSLLKTIAALNRRNEMPDRRVILAPKLDALYLELNPSEREAKRSMIVNADFVLKAPDQSLTELLDARYGETLSEETRTILETAIRFANGVSREGQLGPIVAMPQTEDLEKIMRRLYMEVDVETFRAEVRDDLPQEADLSRLHGLAQHLASEGETPIVHEPQAGSVFVPTWDDRLGDVARSAYADYLSAPGLTDEEADARMQRVLATLMVLNRLQDVELTDVEELYLPSVEHFETALSTRKMRRSIQAFLIRDPELASSVEEASRFTLDKIEMHRENPIQTQKLTLDGIAAAEEELFMLRFRQEVERYVEETGAPRAGAISAVFEAMTADEDFSDTEIVFRKSGESVREYADRLFEGTLTPHELSIFAENPELLLAFHLGFVDRQGEFEPGVKEEVMASLASTGLVGDDGDIILPQERTQRAVDLLTVEAFNEATGHQFELQEGEGVEAFFARITPGLDDPDQEYLVGDYIFYNIMATRALTTDSGLSLDDSEDIFAEEPDWLAGLDDHELSEFEQQLLYTQLFSEEVVESYDLSEDSEDESLGWSPEVERPVYASLEKRGLSFDGLTEARKAEIQEALAKLQAFLDDLELSVEEYENKIQLGSIAIADALENGSPIGGPLSWFG